MARTKDGYKSYTSISSTTSSPPSSTSGGYFTPDSPPPAKVAKVSTEKCRRNWPTCDSDRVMRVRVPRNERESSSPVATSVFRPAKVTKLKVIKPKAPTLMLPARTRTIILKISSPKLLALIEEDLNSAGALTMIYKLDSMLAYKAQDMMLKKLAESESESSDSDMMVDDSAL